MATVPLVRYEDAPREVKEIFDDIKRTRNVDDVNNFWKALANQPETLKRTWALVREVMGPGALDEMTKEMIDAAVSIDEQLRLLHPLAHGCRLQQGDDGVSGPGALGRRFDGALDQRARERLQGSCRRALQARLNADGEEVSSSVTPTSKCSCIGRLDESPCSGWRAGAGRVCRSPICSTTLPTHGRRIALRRVPPPVPSTRRLQQVCGGL